MLTAITEKVPAFQGVVPAADQANYTIEFKSDGSFSAKADCNLLSGTYTTTPEGGLTIILGPSTLAACPDTSLAPQDVAGLGNAASYAIADGQLTINAQGREDTRLQVSQARGRAFGVRPALWRPAGPLASGRP